MLGSRTELRKGCLWLVGNGQNINIFTDPWIPTIQGATPLRPDNGSQGFTKVSELIDNNTEQWNVQALQQLDDPYISNQILRIVPNSTADDKLVWKFTDHGNFTPQSFQKMYKNQQGESSTICESTFPWKRLWDVKRVAPKIKMFVWRVLHNGLGVSKRIGKYITGVSTTCIICMKEEESVDHLLIHCDLARVAWFASPLGLRLQGDDQRTISSLLELLLSRNDNEASLIMGMCLCWAIWKARNEKVFENKSINVQGILTVALYWYNLYFNFNDDEDSPVTDVNVNPDVSIPVTWTAPIHPRIKINVDAAWKDGCYACAAVARNSEGTCLGAGTRLGRSDKVEYAEADGFFLVADLAIWLQLNAIIIEGASQIVVKSLKGELQNTPWRIWRLKDDITRKMLSLNSAGSYNYVPKPANSAAHFLAALAFTHNVQHM
ncbi:uncharacterized protein LOC113311902 [Papaver somniferum]|uniref:uncharacterized protein LOC113311902 n=1 Tax=Papaver somniferum TaxID=3469 RepID=UPI000E6F8BBF|nr:uncharacterized protein LOC113311902 [Papaver somniferum]